MLRTVGLLAFALASGSAQALGLGQIQVKSSLGQPLLAEIPVISNDPSELVNLDAALASPETFTRIGLEPPIGIVADLHFTVGSDARGRPLIRITTTQPVTEPLLNFLVQVDWGQGRLVREYTASVDVPGSIEAGPATPVQAPVAEAPPVVERPVAAVPPPPQQPRARPQQPAPVPERSQQPAAPRATRPQQPAAAVATDSVRVRPGDTASVIASRVAPEGVTAGQTLVGLFRANPEAFIGGDVNRIRQGSVLRVPETTELQAIEAREAADLVRGYARQWRQARTQPQAVAAAPAATPQPARPATPAPAPAGRLEIVPPGAGRTARGGTQSGIAAGGEGDMVRQELLQTKEALAARDAEVQELKSRLADLEKLQADQQKLLALQNSQLHAAQQRQATPPAAPARAPDSSPLPWIAAGALVLVGLLAAAWNRRRSRREPVFRAPVDAPRPSVADAFAMPPAPAPVPEAPLEPAVVVPSWERGARTQPAPVPSAAPVVDPLPETMAGDVGTDAANVERLELAQAYIDLGDTDNARRLLDEVVGTGDATTRGVAAQMLRNIG
ncbi:type IV pilus assembly protein FimV [Lysobacter xanthus]